MDSFQGCDLNGFHDRNPTPKFPNTLLSSELVVRFNGCTEIKIYYYKKGERKGLSVEGEPPIYGGWNLIGTRFLSNVSTLLEKLTF